MLKRKKYSYLRKPNTKRRPKKVKKKPSIKEHRRKLYGRYLKRKSEQFNMPVDTISALHEGGFKVIESQRDKHQYSKSNKKILHFNRDCNLMENLFYIRRYIQKKYKISLRHLEVLIFFYPKNYFQYKEFSHIEAYHNKNIQVYIDKNFINLVSLSKAPRRNVYTLSPMGKKIVRDFYAYLSGVKVINPDSPNNPIKNTKAYDKKVNDGLRIIRNLKSNQKSFYCENNSSDN